MDLARITANLLTKARRATLGGRQYLVAPLTMIVPGVLNGSQGPLYYPPEEVGRNPKAWNHVPLVVYHPSLNGQPASADDPDVLNAQGIGFVLKARYDGKLRGEGWFDVERMEEVRPELIERLENGRAIELSTGLFTDNEEAEGEHSGTPYRAIARNYRPDHLAILPDEVGACSVTDGCGVLVNKEEAATETESQSGEAMNESQKTGLIDHLIANCDCWVEEDRETLNGLSEDKLKALKAELDRANQAAAVANAARKGFEGKNVSLAYDEKAGTFTLSETEPETVTNASPTPPKQTKPEKPQTDEEWLASAPPAIRQVVANAMAKEEAEKAQLRQTILTNAEGVFTEDQLRSKDVAELQQLATLATAGKPQPQPSYAGSAVPAMNAAAQDEDDEPLGLPSMSFDDN